MGAARRVMEGREGSRSRAVCAARPVVKEAQTATAEAAAGYSMNNFTMAAGAAPAAAGGRATGGPEVSV